LTKISEIRDLLENEVQMRDKMRRKYKTLWNVFYTVGQVSGACAIGSGSAAVGTLATGVGIFAAVPLGPISIAAGVISASSVAFGKVIIKKVEKHEGIKRTAESSLNTVDNLVSKALEDGTVSTEDFHHILREMNNYRGHKAGIKQRTRADMIELTAERERQIREEGEREGLKRGKKETVENLLHTIRSPEVE
jgi:hypothetical protein